MLRVNWLSIFIAISLLGCSSIPSKPKDPNRFACVINAAELGCECAYESGDRDEFFLILEHCDNFLAIPPELIDELD